MDRFFFELLVGASVSIIVSNYTDGLVPRRPQSFTISVGVGASRHMLPRTPVVCVLLFKLFVRVRR